MSFRSGVVTGAVATAAVVGVIFFARQAWQQPGPAEAAKSSAPPAPFHVAKPLQEERLDTIELSAAAVARLNLRTAPVEKKPMPRTRSYGGEVVVPPGRSITVSAPLGGT